MNEYESMFMSPLEKAKEAIDQCEQGRADLERKQSLKFRIKKY